MRSAYNLDMWHRKNSLVCLVIGAQWPRFLRAWLTVDKTHGVDTKNVSNFKANERRS